jgi:hypothetical protein
MLRVLKILEMAWLVIMVFSVGMAIYQFNAIGWEGSKWFLGGAFIAAIFYAFRRRQRIRFQEAESTKEEPKD